MGLNYSYDFRLFKYIREHLKLSVDFHIAVKLLKTSVSATIEGHRAKKALEITPAEFSKL